MKETIFLVFVIFLGCKSPTTLDKKVKLETQDIKSNTKPLENSQPFDSIKTFHQYLKYLPSLVTPLKVTCRNDEYMNSDFDIDFSYGIKFRPEGAGIMGRLLVTNNYAAIIYTYPADIVLPILETYNLTGEKICQLVLFSMENCVTDFNDTIETNSSFIITPDIKIQIIDSIFNTKHDKNNLLEKTFKETKISTYSIDDSGRIF